MNRDIINRYIYAVTKQLPRRLRADLEMELRGLIEDVLSERCGGAPPQDDDLHEVLSELGTPLQLAAKYDPNGEKSLIGPPYYTVYKNVLMVVWAAILIASCVVAVIDFIFGTQEIWYLWFMDSISGGVQRCIGGFALVTAVFAFMSHKKISVDRVYSDLNELPPVPSKNEAISRTESIVGIVASVLMTTFLLGAPNVFVVYIVEENRQFPIFNTSFLREYWYIVLFIAILGIADEIVQLIEGRYNKRVAISSVVTGIPSICLLGLLLGRGQFFSPEFMEMLRRIAAESNFAETWLNRLPGIVLMLLVFGILLSISITVYRSWKYNR